MTGRGDVGAYLDLYRGRPQGERDRADLGFHLIGWWVSHLLFSDLFSFLFSIPSIHCRIGFLRIEQRRVQWMVRLECLGREEKEQDRMYCDPGMYSCMDSSKRRQCDASHNCI